MRLVDYLARRHTPCPRCGYDLYRFKTDHCPECGRDLVLQELLMLEQGGPREDESEPQADIGRLTMGLVFNLVLLALMTAGAIYGGSHIMSSIACIAGVLALLLAVSLREAHIREMSDTTREAMTLACWLVPLPCWLLAVLLTPW